MTLELRDFQLLDIKVFGRRVEGMRIYGARYDDIRLSYRKDYDITKQNFDVKMMEYDLFVAKGGSLSD